MTTFYQNSLNVESPRRCWLSVTSCYWHCQAEEPAEHGASDEDPSDPSGLPQADAVPVEYDCPTMSDPFQVSEGAETAETVRAGSCKTEPKDEPKMKVVNPAGISLSVPR